MGNLQLCHMYDQIHIDSVEHILNQAEVNTVGTTWSHVQELINLKKDKDVKSIQWIITYDESSEATSLKQQAE